MKRVRVSSALVLVVVLAILLAACGETVVKEVPVEVVVEKEVVRTVEVPGETVVVEKEVVKTVEVAGETVVVTETVVKEVPVEVVVTKEVVKEVPVEVVVTKEVVQRVEVPVEVVVTKEVVVEKEVVKTLEIVKEIPTPSNFGESPKLATLVRQGVLPPVDQRLPKDPMVIPVVDSIGDYGGEIRRSYLGSNLSCNFGRPIRDGIVRPSMDASAIVMAVAKSVTASPDQKVWTVGLRTGMKWSDGHPFTADDFVYHQERVNDDELTPIKPAYFLTGGTRAKLNKIDDITVEYSYELANSTFLETSQIMDADCGRASMAAESRIHFSPAHYMKQFNAKYANGGRAAVEKMAKDAGFDDYATFYRDRDVTQANPDRPTTRMLVLDSGITQKRIIGNRNPYFYAVDPVGNQLPYIDRWIFDPVSDREAVNLNAIGGLIDFQSRHISLVDVPLFKEHEEKGGFTVYLWPSLEENDAALSLNYSDATEKGEYFRNEAFRHALSYAIDRDKVNQVAFLGLGEARNLMPMAGTPYYPGPEFEYMYMEFDRAKAIEMLDEIMPNKDSDGFRKMASGDVLDIHIYGGQFADTMELVKSDFDKVGIKTTLHINPGAARKEAYKANRLDSSVDHYVASGLIFSYPDKLVPLLDMNASWAPAYGEYVVSGGERGIKPDAEIQQLIDWYGMGATLGDAERFKIGQNIYRQHAEKQYVINIIAHSPITQGVIIVNKDLRNVPEKAANSWPHRAESTGYPEQFYYGK